MRDLEDTARHPSGESPSLSWNRRGRSLRTLCPPRRLTARGLPGAVRVLGPSSALHLLGPWVRSPEGAGGLGGRQG